jgi:hypothetical protein
MYESSRKKWIQILRKHDNYPANKVYEALFKLHHDPSPGDEELIYPLLEHKDPYVAKQALYALFEVYEHRKELRDIIFRLSLGDCRDECEMPLQCQAIYLLSELAASGDREAYERLWEIAEDPSMHESPRTRAWHELAKLHAVEWSDRDLEELIDDPFGEASEAIRHRIREAIRQQGGWEALERTWNKGER